MIRSKIVIFLCLYSTVALDGKTIKFVTRYTSTKYKDAVICYYDYKDNTYNHKINDRVVLKYSYKSKADFIKERSLLGITCFTSLNIDMPTKKDKCNNTYDVQHRLVKESGKTLKLIWNKWDNKNRNISGKMLVENVSDDVLVNIDYYDDLKTAKAVNSNLSKLLEKIPVFPVETILKYDDYNNIISTTYKLSNGKVHEEITNILEYGTIQ